MRSTFSFSAPASGSPMGKAWGVTDSRAKRAMARCFLRETRGVAALEFAIVAPVLMLMLMGMVCFGLYFVYLHELQEIAASAARASVAGLSQTERDSLARQFVAVAVTNSSLLLPSDLTVSTATSGTPATLYAVTLDYSLKDTPLPLLAGFVHLQTSDISRTSTIEFGNY